MTLWAAVVAERLGYSQAEALRVGLREPGAAGKKWESPRPSAAKKAGVVELLGREVPVVRTPDGMRALSKDKPDSPDAVEKYLGAKFGDALAAARRAMAALAAAYSKDELAANAYALYEQFRPRIPPGKAGWGAKG